MNIKRFKAKDSKTAMNLVRQEFGQDAIILSSRDLKDGKEIIATNEYPIENEQPQEVKLYKPKVIDAYHQGFQNNDISDEIVSAKENRAEQELIESIDSMVSNERTEIQNLKDEINLLRSLMQEQLSGLIWQKMEAKNPLKADISRKLSQFGFSANIVHNCLDKVYEGLSLSEGWKRIKDSLVQKINVAKYSIFDTSGQYTLIGPSGVGKTTIIAQIASHFVLRHNKEDILLISIDDTKVGGCPQFDTFSKILGIESYQLDNIIDIQNYKSIIEKKRLVIIDTPSIHMHDDGYIIKIKSLNKVFPDMKNISIIPTPWQYENIRDFHEILTNYLKIHGCFLTHVDNAKTLGESISVIIENNLKIHGFMMGSKIPQDYKILKPPQIIEMALSYSDGREKSVEDSVIARNFSKVITNV